MRLLFPTRGNHIAVVVDHLYGSLTLYFKLVLFDEGVLLLFFFLLFLFLFLLLLFFFVCIIIFQLLVHL
jgi:hypothetical protein